ncbi:hypothetical protein Sdel_1114 [Sulfurospirillum deleyianum DSM 6946]|uniref:Uncharacterized protein n=1 Tax=Sulfurospirillum deleyianum (strain ATCC 51133 / DSM 6946 / 5175) TaxID=525898 RepID=D1B217_SULD5|nr:hypothetical protein Sdel_1114 [Sulfurospirillum deleyianum DSM 6946]
MEECCVLRHTSKKALRSLLSESFLKRDESISAKALTRGGKSPYLFVIFFKLKYDGSTPMKFSLFQSSSSLTLSFSFSFIRCAAHSVASSFACAALSLLNERFRLGMTTSNKRRGGGCCARLHNLR